MLIAIKEIIFFSPFIFNMCRWSNYRVKIS
jgi:hypothetical protein